MCSTTPNTMEACQAVAREQEKVTAKLEALSASTRERLNDALSKLEALKNNLNDADEVTEQHREAMRVCQDTVKSTAHLLSQEHKDIHAPISKLGRSIDKHFQQEITGVSVKEVFAGGNGRLLNRSLCEHLLREGRMDVAETLINEMGLSRDESFVSMFTDIHSIAQSLRTHCVESALEWVDAHQGQLARHGSSLEFKLHQRKFLSLVETCQITQAVAYAKVLGQFTPRHIKEVQRLMGCLLFVNKGLSNSPYADLLDPWHWTDVVDTFTRDACQLLGLSIDSPLAVSLSIGCSALPQLLHLQSVMAQRQVSDVLSHHNELPCEVQLSWDHRFHSIFTCPILRQQTSDQNPPVRLSCGHAISRDAMKRLVNGHSGRLKCPYCPVEMYSKDIQHLKF